MIIEAEDLKQEFRGKVILQGVNLRVRKGEVFALIGPTGAGKTTLLRLLGLLDLPSSGKIFFWGKEVTRSGDMRFWARRRMAFVMQRPKLFGGDVFYNVACGLKWRGMARGHIVERVKRALELVGLEGYLRRDTRTLSGGEAQRVAIARAIAIEPEVLILDEPTSNLDPHSVSKIEEVIEKLAQGGMTILLATHSLVQAQRLSDRIGVILGGRLVQVGTPEEIFYMPKDEEVAGFVGVENVIEGTVEEQDRGVARVRVSGGIIEAVSSLPPGCKVRVCLRPEDIVLSLSTIRSSARNHLLGKITKIAPFGPFVRVEVDCGPRLKVLITRVSAEEMALKEGMEVFCSFKATSVHLLAKCPSSERYGTQREDVK